ncbi:MAG: ATPase [Bacteroidia bacterium]|nr:MAG: ATPase [Bacteroidia bacterium]
MEEAKEEYFRNKIHQENKCFHCGGALPKKPIERDEHLFCCKGCVSVYGIIKDSGLENIYQQNTFGNFSKPIDDSDALEFSFLDNPSVQEKLVSFKEGNICKIVLYAPDIHCASCIWLLEHLPRLHRAIIQSQVNFHDKKISTLYDDSKISLKELAILLTQIGYKPYFSLEKKKNEVEDKKLLMQLGVAGFAFGNIMLLSFPDYLDSLSTLEVQYADLFHYVSFMLSIPVLFFSARPYLKSAWSGIKTKDLNMDIPIGIGILTLFFRSVYDVFVLHESGYFDSLSGFVFFLLIGRWYQQKTYRFLDFDKTFHSFFPVSVIKVENLNEINCEVNEIKENDLVKLRNGELIPFDCVLMSNEAQIDYSFVTGESDIFQKKKGDLIYAGGKLYGQKILVRVKKPFDQKYFMQLWTENSTRKNASFKKISAFLGKLITTVVLAVAIAAVVYWKDAGDTILLKNVSSVLIIGCSCAFALSAPFLFGNVSRILSKLSFFVKNPENIATLADVKHIVLDKTGTLTEKGYQAEWVGERSLTESEINLLYAVFQNSFHPLSKKICDYLKPQVTEFLECSVFNEYSGRGIEAVIQNNTLKAGSKEWVGYFDDISVNASLVFVKLNNQILGYFKVQNKLREGIDNIVESIKSGYNLHILTGDNSHNVDYLKELFPHPINILTQQSPEDKKNYINALQEKGEKVLMIGDGLNDMPALKTADFGISITDEASYFAPSGDAIMKGESLKYLPHILEFARVSNKFLHISYIFSFVYNSVGLLLAFNGYLNPLVAAIFMPLSSISVVIFAIYSTNYYARRIFKSELK